MIFIILAALGIVGMVGTVWISSASLRYAEHPVARGDEWFILTPEKIESQIANVAHAKFREVVKIILKWAIKQYRETQQKITVKQEIKKHVRAFLYEHKNDGERSPSKMWEQLQNPSKPDKLKNVVISPDEITSSIE